MCLENCMPDTEYPSAIIPLCLMPVTPTLWCAVLPLTVSGLLTRVEKEISLQVDRVTAAECQHEL